MSDWTKDGKFSHRQYESYAEYVAHQKRKFDELNKKKFENYCKNFYQSLFPRLPSPVKLNNSNVNHTALCIGARQGTEVQVLRDKGWFAVGIDLNPGKDNEYVHYGDMHNLQFPDNSVHLIYTNAFDHSLHPDKFIAECKRVLAPDGVLIMEISKGSAEGREAKSFESLWWERVNDVINMITNAGFRWVSRNEFDHPWKGEQVRFERN